MCIVSTYLTGSSLIALGLVWWQAIIVIVVAAILSTVFIVLNSLPGAFYHVGFPIANRYVWGMYGSYFVIYNRILLSLVWYAVQAWIGGYVVRHVGCRPEYVH
jgi:nucleobase:cation symporter-1, NCS1 family